MATLSVPQSEANNEVRHLPQISKSPVSGDSLSFEVDDQDSGPRTNDVHASLLRRLSLVEFHATRSGFEFRRRLWFKALITVTCITSFTSVSLNTPYNIKSEPRLLKITFGLDLAAVLVLTAECCLKIAEKGFFRQKKSYLRSPGRVFEFTMVLFIWISLIFHALEMADVINPFKTHWYNSVSGLRCPRPLLLFRVGKNLLHVGIPKSVSKKPLRQIRNVLLFAVYAMTLVAIIGVQIFGSLSGYCVKNTTNTEKVTYQDFMIPASRCNVHSHHSGYKCPEGFACKEIKGTGFYHMNTYFKQAAVGLLTVYEAQSQEGWTRVMYDAMDSQNDLAAVVYFLILIIFIAWLAKNIFIAIVTEVFADLRSQVHRFYNTPSKNIAKDSSKIFVHRKTDSGLQLIQGDQFEKTDVIRYTLRRIVKSRVFRWFFLLCIVCDALLQGYLTDQDRIFTQIAFTLLFDLEVLLKLIGYGPKVYFNCVPHRFETFLAVGSSAFLAPLCLKREGLETYALFKVLRPFRLILALPSLASFLKRILGSGKKLGSLLLFTMIFLLVAAGVSLQLFCNIKITDSPSTVDDISFKTFPAATRAMFQVLMQEAWNDVLHTMLEKGGQEYAILIFLFFIFYHVLATLILISVFVALILDNLELDEEVKIIKQHQLGEVADLNQKLPLRLRVFENLKARPKIVKMEKIGCSIPKVRESFMTNYLQVDSNADVVRGDLDFDHAQTMPSLTAEQGASARELGINLVSMSSEPPSLYTNKTLRKQSSVSALIKWSHEKKGDFDSSLHRGRIAPRGGGGSAIRRKVSNQQQSTEASPAGPSRAVLGRTHSANFAIAVKGNISSSNHLSFISAEKTSEKNLDVVRLRLREAQRRKERQVQNLRENYPYFDKSLFFLPYDNRIRVIIRKIVHARYVAFSDKAETRLFSAFSLNRFRIYLGSQAYLDWFMMLLTHLSCYVMMLETPQQRTFQYPLTKYVEYIFVITTTIEIGLKILADGFFLTPTALTKDFGGVLHVFIYIVGLVYICWHPGHIRPNSLAQIILVLRALRPLRIITLSPPLRNVVQIFVRGYKDILKVAVLQLLLMFVFANYGVQMFQGHLGRCTEASIKTRDKCTGLCNVTLAAPASTKGLRGKEVSVTVPCVWQNPRNFNFETFPNAFLALFEVLSLEGWTVVRDIMGKQIGHSASLYLHAYVFLAGLIGLTLFIGVVVSNFNENKGTALLTVDQRRWQDLKKRLKLSQPIHVPPRPENNEKKARVYDFLQKKFYRFTYIFIVLLNGCTLMAVNWYPTSLKNFKNEDNDGSHASFTGIAIMFTYVYLIDLIIKLQAYGLTGYWLSWRNRFDAIFTLLGVVWSIFQIISYWHVSFQPATLRGGVALIILRLFTLVGKINFLKMIMLTLSMSLFKSFYTISVLVVLMMCYALVGVIMFGSVRFGLHLNRHASFRTSFSAMLLLFRITTGEDWNLLMHDCMVKPPKCSLNENDNFWETDCGNEFFAQLFFFSYYIIITYIFLNLFIAVVIENFSLFSSADEDMLMSDTDLKAFQEVWNIIDRDCAGKLTPKRAKLALGLSIAKLKFSVTTDRFLYKRMCAEIDRVCGGKDVSYHDLLLVLAYNDPRVKLSRNLQLEERLAREDQIRAITEEVAAQTIGLWCLRMWQEKLKNRKNSGRLHAKQSGMLFHSLLLSTCLIMNCKLIKALAKQFW